MQTKYTINSDAYWDSRFVEDWESFQGPAQSRFFARLAIENLPRWLIDQLQRQPLTLCDWGCAQGDGTDVWASYVDSDRITGIDFSSVAVDQALKRYPAIRFLNEDWLAAQPGEQSVFDVVFSSNTLEHFHKPHAVLKSLCSRATKALVLALPYRELDRHHEHFYTFLPDNIPTAINGGFKLVWSRVVDCRQISNTLWGGDQIVLVYANSDWTDALRLTLRDFGIEQSDFAAKIVSLNQAVTERDGQIVSLNQAVTERDGQITSLIEAVVERDEQITGLNQAVAERDGRITSQYAQLMTFSNWASSIDKHPLKHAFKKTALGIARGTLRSMPVSIATKQRLRDVFFSTIRPLRQSVRRKSAQVRPADEAAPPRGQRPSAGVARDVFVFAVIDWHFRIQRPQHIARSLAESGHRVFYFSNHFVDADEPGYQLERLPGADALYQVKLHVKGAPAIYFDPPSDQALAMLTRSIAKVIQDFSALSSLSIVQHAYWYPLVKRLPNSYRIYDCMDHHEGFGNVPAKLVEIEKEMLCSADLVTVTSSWLEDFARKHNPSVALVRNAAEYRHFVTRPEQVYKDGKGRRIIGYYGAIAEWFDIDLVRTIALEHPDCLILLVGNDTVGAQKVLADLPNVEFTGEVPYATLPFYLHAFDVCLLPFKVIPLTLATNPVKVYEYLAAGKPVVCVDLPEVGQFGDLVSRACSTDDFVALVGASLQESGVLAEQKSAERRRFASEQTWCHRGAELATALKAVRMPRVSVIILTFNNLDLTRACLDSVLERSDYPNLEVIVVDNASSDGTSAYLEDFARRHPDVRVVLNRENLGFAAGNNVGLSIATGDYLVVLNNDTVVTQGWVMTLLRHFQNDPSLGIVGPVTNNIGNEARIETRYQSMEEMPGEALRYTLANMGNTYPIRTAAFFCVMFPRSVYELCGPICEDYGRGFFEDDDYCRRVESIGKRVVCADDVFIHHHLSASFNKLKDSERQELFRKNKEIYEKKWGPWVPHSYRNQMR
ncbi:TPA: glycosyltransferase [Pseudomonas aeruginosa]|uniref:glycosyltransferase n=1 Tax=Pseudomonas aeruginosa TaxID=287 RepID=UPI0008FBAD20|nr:glycosyltransferase [Pseudomonas aeruginosa]KSR08872.2 hypothetical protein APB43_30145 [Pseudomonas aeruginosa]RMK46209.1 hypothetical protein IPC92_14115 [Pseudomonas aeruginosa]